MIKGVLLALSASSFIVSLIFSILGVSGNLHESILTGAVIGSGSIINYSLLGIVVFGILSAVIIFRMRK